MKKVTRLTVETDNDWTKKKIKDAIYTEKELFKKAVQRSQNKLQAFEKKYGNLIEILYMAKWMTWSLLNGKESLRP